MYALPEYTSFFIVINVYWGICDVNHGFPLFFFLFSNLFQILYLTLLVKNRIVTNLYKYGRRIQICII